MQGLSATMERLSRVNDEARAMWLKAHKAIEEARKMHAEINSQIEELARHDGFRRRYRDTMLAKILEAAIESTHADMGNIQLLDPDSGRLMIRVQSGFQEPFLKFFNCVDCGQAACGTAMKTGRRIIIEDTANSPIFAGHPSLEVMLDANARAVQSTPLVGRSGDTIGILSTHYRIVRKPSPKDLRTIDRLAKLAVSLIEWHGNRN